MYYKLDHKNDIHKNIFSVSWFIGNTCNFSCDYCPKNLHDGSTKWPEKEHVIRFLEKLKKQKPNKMIYISFIGGEVTLWKDFLEVCHSLNKYGIRVSFHSNGSRTLSWWKQLKPLVHNVNLSYHFKKTNLSHMIDVINILNGLKLHLNVMMDVDNFDICLEVANKINKMCDEIDISLQPLTVNMDGEIFPYSENQLNIISDTKYKPKKPIISSSHRGLMKKIYEDTEEIVSATQLIINNENSWVDWQCYSGIENLVIDPSGDITRGYCKVGGLLGNIFKDYKLPSEPVVCNKQICSCHFDIMSKKVKN